MNKPRIGIVCLVRKTFDFETAFKLYKERTKLVEEDKSVDWFNYNERKMSKMECCRNKYNCIYSIR